MNFRVVQGCSLLNVSTAEDCPCSVLQCAARCCSVLQCVAGIQSTLFARALPLAVMRLVSNVFVLLLSDDSHQLSLLHDHLREKEKERKKSARERERARSKRNTERARASVEVVVRRKRLNTNRQGIPQGMHTAY